ncbi:aminotransferase A [Falsibacillus albus]|uniref:Aminotransferase n=1 Tax=Falsibacillus albus TaxID=2478915 RepID=A0A3L7K2N6_9BACI|nr:aminotransferase A [Falsibacillus albus]RLQ97080.1 aminotransferase A [Falsibacillus albus]
MEHLLNQTVKNIEISGIRKFFNMVNDFDDLVSLTIGQPDFHTPLHIKEAGESAIQENFTSYTHNAGYFSLREAACDFVKEKYGLTYDPNSEVIVTVGASQALDIALRTILSKGDEVIIPGPVYPGYEPLIRLSGGVPVYTDISKNKFRMSAKLINEQITEKTKCIILPYPSNPTGVSLSKEELLEISELIKGKEIFILADEIYSEIVYEQNHVSIAKFLREQTILINGLSKSHAMTGWRIGLLFAPSIIARHILKVHQYNVSCASSISQKAAHEALANGKYDAVAMTDEYKERRDYVYERLMNMGLETVLPEGAFYFFVKIPETIKESSFDFAVKLAKEGKLAVVPGSAFSKYGEGFFRISYACAMETLKDGLDRLQRFLELHE